ncbi:DUF1285 domain-containing protein [Alkalimarinus sediminis]|uniref:DUF1285 domain-containing protein n=1 Tax=Alkalimarinus sediminis TaxID=1632866 RepID=A0A9E8HKN6_9ALTE|nr:DUF1285 domain-containing protein [Alkalimarinus sediminis]UZW76194.1 DUF1285 domain-containing protein [Alkalimarinus sediminis]
MTANKTHSDNQGTQLEKTMQVVADIEASKKGGGYPPVEKWHPEVVGEIDIRIDREGIWYYQGDQMARKEMVKLFSSILRLDEGDGYYLVTPVEKMKISVDVAPFSIVDFRVENRDGKPMLVFKDSVGEDVLLNKQDQLLVSQSESGEPIPLITVRRNLKGLVNRNVFYRLVDIADSHTVDGKELIGVWSSGLFFPLQ